MRVLVVYASADGSTREIAERIAARLAAAGHQPTTEPPRALNAPAVGAGPVSESEAVVIGSAVHNRQWLDDATMFVHGHRPALAERPLWVFSVGMPAALPGPLRGLGRTEESAVLGHLDGLKVQGHRLFSGVVKPSQFPPASRLFLKLIGGRYGDFRDWPAIDAWADGIAADLDARAAGRPGPQPSR